MCGCALEHPGSQCGGSGCHCHEENGLYPVKTLFQLPGTIKVPIKFDGFVVGEAEISKNGEIITAELNASGVGREIRDVLLSGFADSISIRPNYIPSKKKEN